MWKTIWMSTGSFGNTIAGNFIGMTALGTSLGYSGVAGVSWTAARTTT